MFNRIWRGYGRFLYACGLIAGFTTFAMMILVFINVFARYAFNNPIGGAFEIAQSMLVVLVFLSLALTQYHDAHIRVVLLTQNLPHRLQKILRVATLLLGGIFFAWATQATWHFAMESYVTGELEWGSIKYPLYPVKFTVCFGLFILSIQFFLSAVRFAMARPEDIETLSSGEENVH